MTTPNPDTPIERAARALALEFEPYPDEAFVDHCRRHVLAVLTAIRTPDEGMYRAGLDAAAFGRGPRATERAFTAMIDHLIASGEQ